MTRKNYHQANLTTATCLRCEKPMSQWSTWDVCPNETRGHIIPSSPPTGFSDKGLLYQCDSCPYKEEVDEDEPPSKCPKCPTGMMSIEGWINEHGNP